MLFPCNKYILCRQANAKKDTEDNFSKVIAFTDFKKEVVPEYEVVESSSDLFNKGDIIVVDSDGTTFDNGNEKQVVFSEKSIVGKLNQGAGNGQI